MIDFASFHYSSCSLLLLTLLLLHVLVFVKSFKCLVKVKHLIRML